MFQKSCFNKKSKKNTGAMYEKYSKSTRKTMAQLQNVFKENTRKNLFKNLFNVKFAQN